MQLHVCFFDEKAEMSEIEAARKKPWPRQGAVGPQGNCRSYMRSLPRFNKCLRHSVGYKPRPLVMRPEFGCEDANWDGE